MITKLQWRFLASLHHYWLYQIVMIDRERVYFFLSRYLQKSPISSKYLELESLFGAVLRMISVLFQRG